MGDEVNIADGNGCHSEGAVGHVGEVVVSICNGIYWGLDVVVGGVSSQSAAQSESEGNSNEGFLHLYDCKDRFLTFFWVMIITLPARFK